MGLWVPIASLPVLRAHDPGERNLLTQADDCCVYVVGRLAAGVSRSEAEAELQVLSDRFRASTSQPTRPIALDGTQFLRGRRAASTALAVIGVLFLGLVLVLLLACANVGNLVLARAAARTGEIGVRLSLGAGRSRIVRQLLTEGFVLALLASAVGIAVAIWVPDLVVNRLAGQPAPFDYRSRPRRRRLRHRAGGNCLSDVRPGARAARDAQQRAGVAQADDAERSGMRLRSVLLGIQVAVTVVLLTSAGLLLRGVVQARAIDPGFRVDGLAIAKFELPEGAYDIARSTAFLTDLTSGLRDAGLKQFGFTTTEPFGERSTFAGIRRPGEGKERTQSIEFMAVSPDYFQTIGIPMAAGRAFDVADEGQNVAIVNESAARRMWSGQTAVGQSLVIGERDTLQVVGVVKDTHIDSLDDVAPLLFLPLTRAHADDFPRLLFEADQPAAAAAVTSLVGQMDRRARVEIQPLGCPAERPACRARARAARRVGARTLRPRPGHRRHVRRIRVCGAPAHARDRHPHRARRALQRNHPSRADRQLPACDRGTCRGNSRRARRLAGAPQRAVRRQPARSADLRRRRAAAVRRRDGGELPPRATRGAAQPDAGPPRISVSISAVCQTHSPKSGMRNMNPPTGAGSAAHPAAWPESPEPPRDCRRHAAGAAPDRRQRAPQPQDGIGIGRHDAVRIGKDSGLKRRPPFSTSSGVLPDASLMSGRAPLSSR